MKYLLSIFITSLLFFSVSVTPTYASLVTVQPDGGVVVNVLADETSTIDIAKNDSVEVKNSIAYAGDSQSKITLKNDGGNVSLSVLSANDTKTMDVGSYKDNVVDIEARPETEHMAIKVDGNSFLIEQQSVVAKTDYAMTVDPKEAKIMLDAPSGNRLLSVTPREATQTLLRAKTITDYEKEGSVTITETADHELAYEVKGKKVLNFFNFYYYPVDVTSYVSALTGEIVSVDQPLWLSIVGFLFA